MLQLTVIQAEQATLVWLFAGVLLGVLLGAVVATGGYMVGAAVAASQISASAGL